MAPTGWSVTIRSHCSTQGATLLTGRAFEIGGRLPYQVLVHALNRRLEEEQAPEALLSATWLSELSRILPELRERYPFLLIANILSGILSVCERPGQPTATLGSSSLRLSTGIFVCSHKRREWL
jgi:hypothetical protein